MAHVKVKICGIRSLDEAQAAIDAGCDALGFNFWKPSPRYIEPVAARDVIGNLSPLVPTIGVFVNELPGRILEIAHSLGLSAAQLHGDESPEFCEQLGELRLIKAIRVGQDFDLDEIRRYPVGMVLLDSSTQGSYGGTGRRFDWRIAVEAKKLAPIILAGGLTRDNVRDAIIQVRPSAIDVCSGVEAEPGRKDLNKLRDFMSVVSQANAAAENESATTPASKGFLP